MDSFQTNHLKLPSLIDGDEPILRVGLTGGIGSGKSEVANFLGKLGAAIIDTDAISHQITASSGLAIPAIRQQFGEKMIAPDGSLDRHKMRTLIFDNPSSKLALENITHPLIFKITEDHASAALQQNPSYIVFVVPLLIESGQWLGQTPKKIDYVVVVDSTEDQQLSRVQSRSNMDPLSIQKIIATQANREERLAAADYIIKNDGSLAELEKKTAQLHESLVHRKNL
jgi:dephospho-CoA kinase